MELTFEDWRDAVSLVSRYARSVDAPDTETVLGCFTDDVSLNFEGGKRVVTGRAEASDFYHGVHAAKRIPSTHLLSNYGIERVGSSVVVQCSALVCTSRKAGFVTIKGLVYGFTCVRVGSELRIQNLQHGSKWECEAPGGQPAMAWLSDNRPSAIN
jgi:hypothetical protein